MSISYQFGDVDAHGALIRAQDASLEAEHQAIVRDVLAAGDFWGGSGSVACQEFITQLAATSRPSTSKPTPTAKKSRPPATTCRAPTPPSAPAGPDASPTTVVRTPPGVRATTISESPKRTTKNNDMSRVRSHLFTGRS